MEERLAAAAPSSSVRIEKVLRQVAAELTAE
ncbi:hypothetical protein BJY22_007685 [Kribbella shirazensis]|uniref:Uncharacterized protein n=1 Tax=Kribbella shirazensis TaxID=1105143 RepID=A0A7X6A5H2_9ACTN|nr:hypothetical protein [Kribbella shirazensis]